MALVFDDPEAEEAESKSGPADDDPVRRYLREIGRVPLLTARQEVELGRRIEVAETALRRAVASVPEGLAALLEAGSALRRGTVPAEEVIALTDRSDVEPKDVRAALRGFARLRRLATGRPMATARTRRSASLRTVRAKNLTAVADTVASIALSPVLVARIAGDVLAAGADTVLSARRQTLLAEIERCQHEIRDGKRALTEA